MVGWYLHVQRVKILHHPTKLFPNGAELLHISKPNSPTIHVLLNYCPKEIVQNEFAEKKLQMMRMMTYLIPAYYRPNLKFQILVIMSKEVYHPQMRAQMHQDGAGVWHSSSIKEV